MHGLGIKILPNAKFYLSLCPKEYIIFKLLQFMKAKFLNMIIGILMLSFAAGCSDKDDPNDAPGDYSLKVKVNCTADSNNDSSIELVIANDSVSQEPVDILPGTNFEKEFEIALPEVPSTAGFVVFPSIAEEGGKCEFSVKGEVTLLKGNKVITTKSIDEKHSVTDLDTDHTAAYLFEATQRGLERVGGFSDIDLGKEEKPYDAKEDYNKADSINDITKLVKPYVVKLTFNDKVDMSEYRDPKKKPNNVDAAGTKYDYNTYSVVSKIYNVYDEIKKKNVYFIEQFISTEFATCYAGVYNKYIKTGALKTSTIAKICEWYGDYVLIETAPYFKDIENEGTTLPETAEMNETKSCGFSWNIGAKLTYSSDKGAGGEVSGGLSASRTYSYTIPDIKIANDCKAGQYFRWIYELKSARTVFNMGCTAGTDMKDPSYPGRHTMNKQTAFAFSTTTTPPQVVVMLKVGLKSTAGKCGDEHGTRTRSCYRKVEITLPYWYTNAKGELEHYEGKSVALAE